MSTNRKINLAVLMAATVLLAVLAGSPAQAGSKPKPPPGLDTGKVYYETYDYGNPHGAIWSMLPDGSQKTYLVPSAVGDPHASAALHGGSRWFIGTMEVAPEPYYVDGHPRVEVVAQSEDGRVVQLTDMTDPYTKISVATSWAMHEGVADGKASFVKLNASWDEQGWWNWDVGGLYVIEIGWTEAGEPMPLTEPAEVLPVAGIPGQGAGVSYDWSPDGGRVVRHSGGMIYIDDSTVPLCSGWGPKWSPVRSDGSTLIAFHVGGWGGSIHTIRPDGSGETSIVTSSSQQVTHPVAWSPHGTYLVYTVVRNPKPMITQSTHDVYRVSAEGGSTSNLTNDVGEHCDSVGWRGDLAIPVSSAQARAAAKQAVAPESGDDPCPSDEEPDTDF